MNRKVGQASRLSDSAGFQPAPAGKMPALLSQAGCVCYLQSRFMVPMHAKKRMGVLSMNLDIGARLCAQHQPQHAGNIQSAAAGSWTTAALQEIRPGSWSQCMRKKTERGLSM